MIERLRGLFRLESLALAFAVVLLVVVTFAQQRAGEPPPALDSYSTYDAGAGGYRALYEMLGRLGIRVERFEQPPAFLDSGIARLVYVEPIVNDPRARVPTRGDIGALEAWVRGGGSLLYIGFDDVAATEGILHLPRLAFSHGGARAYVAPELRALGVANFATNETLRYASRKNARVLLADARGALVLTYRFGRGTVTAAIDRSAFRNAALARGDRARLVFALARPADAGGVVAFDEVPHGFAVPQRWWSIVPRPFAIALALAVVVLFVAIAGAALRLGPPLVPAPRDDRSSADFVVAVASLYERNGDVRATLAQAAASTTRALARARGLGATATNDEIAARLASDEERTSFREMTRVAANGYPDSATLVRGVALAQKLRKDISAHDGSRN